MLIISFITGSKIWKSRFVTFFICHQNIYLSYDTECGIIYFLVALVKCEVFKKIYAVDFFDSSEEIKADISNKTQVFSKIYYWQWFSLRFYMGQ